MDFLCNDAAYGVDIAQYLIQWDGGVALGVDGVGLGEDDEAVDSGGGIGVDGAAVEAADGSHGDFEWSQVGGPRVLFACLLQGGDEGFGLIDGEGEAVPSVAESDCAAESGGAFSGDDDGWGGALDGAGEGSDIAE